MKSFFTKISFVLLIVFGLSTFLSAQVYIWGGPGDPNSEFAGGLNDWTTSENNGTSWIWTADGTGSEGTYWGEIDPINSASVDNGAALFNSDKFNSVDGIDWPHRGELTSPAFSCEGHNTVYVRFDQICRYWRASENQTFLQVSTDGGTTWLPGDGISANYIPRWNFSAWSWDSQKLFDISEYAANQPNVQIRFVWNGSYYFWILDDVYVMEQPDIDLEVSPELPFVGQIVPSHEYPVQASQFPASQVDAEPMQFSMLLANRGFMDAENITATVSIVDGDDNVYYEDVVEGNAVPAGDTVEVTFENTYLPELDELGVGTHYVVYEANIDGMDDLTEADNFVEDRFFLSEGNYNQGYYDPNYSWGSNDGLFGAFNVFKTGSWSNVEPGYKFIIDSLSMAVSDGADLETFLADVNVYIYKVSDDVMADFSNFETEVPAQFDPEEDAHPQLELIGLAFESSFQHDDFDVFKVGVYDTEFNANINIEPNTTYLVMAFWDTGAPMYHCMDLYKWHNGNVHSGWYAPWGENEAFIWDTAPWFGWLLGMDINYVEVEVGTEDLALPENTLNAYPVPAKDFLNIDVSFDQIQENGTVVLTDMTNKYINSLELNDFKTANETMDVTNVPSGNYILRLITENGSIEKKIVIQH